MTHKFENHSKATDLQHQDGARGTIAPLPETEYDRDEVGQMFIFTTESGDTFHVFADEVTEV